MAARLFILIALAIHVLSGWSAIASRASATIERAEISVNDSCGSDCCCPPKACPCMHAPTPVEREQAPATPPRSERHDAPKIAQRADSANTFAATGDSSARTGASFDFTGRPRGDVTRRVQQLQCVWRT